MELQRIGLRIPTSVEGLTLYGDSPEEYSYIHNRNTGMEYELWKDSDDRLFLKAWHEDVGQEVWYYVDMEQWKTLESLSDED